MKKYLLAQLLVFLMIFPLFNSCSQNEELNKPSSLSPIKTSSGNDLISVISSSFTLSKSCVQIGCSAYLTGYSVTIKPIHTYDYYRVRLVYNVNGLRETGVTYSLKKYKGTKQREIQSSTLYQTISYADPKDKINFKLYCTAYKGGESLRQEIALKTY